MAVGVAPLLPERPCTLPQGYVPSSTWAVGRPVFIRLPRWEVLTWAVLSYKLGSFRRFHLEGPLPLLEGTLVPRSGPRPAVHPPLALAMLVGWLNGCRGTRRFLLWASVFHW